LTALDINGRRYRIDEAGDTPLLWVLRERLGLTGTKYGCGIGQCGACTVHIGGAARLACITPISSLDRQPITTIEGLAGSPGSLLMQAWLDHDVSQCGYCQPGQLMAAAALLARNREPTDADIDIAMSGVLCRCGTYGRIRAAIHDAAARLPQGA
jgi:isoquinoline 1-oxidoreductase alpha subunit